MFDVDCARPEFTSRRTISSSGSGASVKKREFALVVGRVCGLHGQTLRMLMLILLYRR